MITKTKQIPRSELESLPSDVLRTVLGFLGTRHLLLAATSCRTVRDVVATMPLRPVITWSNCDELRRWLARPEIASRVVKVTANYSVWECRFIHRLANLTHVSIRFSLLSPPELQWLPTSLQAVELHRVSVGLGRPFYLTRLAHLVNARVIKLTFLGQDGVGHVFVSSTDRMPHLRCLSVRQAPRLVVICPLNLQTLHLHATDSLLCAHVINAEHVHLECVESPIMHEACLTEASCAGLRSLDIRCPERAHMPDLRWAPRLESLHVDMDAPIVPLAHLAALTALRHVSIEARYGVEKTCPLASLPRRVKTSIAIGGVPMAQRAVDEFFNLQSPVACTSPPS